MGGAPHTDAHSPTRLVLIGAPDPMAARSHPDTPTTTGASTDDSRPPVAPPRAGHLELQARREALGLAQIDVAALLGIHQVNISRWETGTSTPRHDVLTPAYDALEDTLDALTTALADTSSTDTDNSRERNSAPGAPGIVTVIDPTRLDPDTLAHLTTRMTTHIDSEIPQPQLDKLIRIAAGRARRQMANKTNTPTHIIAPRPLSQAKEDA